MERQLPYGAKKLNDPALVAELAGQILKDAYGQNRKGRCIFRD